MYYAFNYNFLFFYSFQFASRVGVHVTTNAPIVAHPNPMISHMSRLIAKLQIEHLCHKGTKITFKTVRPPT